MYEYECLLVTLLIKYFLRIDHREISGIQKVYIVRMDVCMYVCVDACVVSQEYII